MRLRLYSTQVEVEVEDWVEVGNNDHNHKNVFVVHMGRISLKSEMTWIR